MLSLHFVDLNVLSREEQELLQEGQVNETALHQLAFLADPLGYSTHGN
jgi:hypothetical protein